MCDANTNRCTITPDHGLGFAGEPCMNNKGVPECRGPQLKCYDVMLDTTSDDLIKPTMYIPLNGDNHASATNATCLQAKGGVGLECHRVPNAGEMLTVPKILSGCANDHICKPSKVSMEDGTIWEHSW